MRIELRVTIAASREEVWDLIRDPAEYPRLMSGITSFDPEDPEREPGLHSRYHMRIRVGSADVGGLVEIVEYSPPRDLAWTSVTGIDQRGRLRVRDAPGGRTTLTVRFSYGAPGALLGTLAELVSVPQVSANLRRSLDAVKRAAEGTDQPVPNGPSLPARLLHEAANVGILAQAGIVRPLRPDKLARLGIAAARWRASPAMGVIAGAIRHRNRTMIIDELGSLTYREVDRRSNTIANALAETGVGEGDRVGVMCRDHRGFVEATLAVAKLGADVLLLNTSFAGPQLAEVSRREQAAALIYDEEFTDLVKDAGRRRKRFVAWHESDRPPDTPLYEVAENGDPSAPAPPGRTGRVTILTSGTTGTPKGAARGAVLSLDAPAALLERIPMHEGQVTRIAAPLFHAWGFSHFALGMALGATFVLRRRFDAEQCLADIAEHRCEVLVVVPVMLQRILELPEGTRRKYDTSSLRAVCASGSALPGDLATRWMDEFGDNLYNLYGSTEVAAATLATPADMRAAPGTAGKPARGSIVRLYDPSGRPVLQGATGRIFVGNASLFQGYTGGGTKDQIDGLMSSGDVGRFDEAGRLFVEGRDDEMIVSGGENVFPKEVEDLLSKHAAVKEAAAIGVDDDKFGQRLRAFVVLEPGKQITEDELKEHVRQSLARYKVPREVVFVDELPRNPTGKVLKRELRELEV
jgi:acyl-CoA synthetase (AMP-forming)/AMP-acid ligase II/uncharacterized membrane protein